MEEDLNCPECGNGFSTKAALAAHRKFKHDVPSPNAKQPLSEKVLERLEEITSRIDEVQGKLNDGQEVTNMPSDEELNRMCERFPGLCAKVDRIANVVESHPKPSRGLLDIWDNCPECRSMLQAMADRGEFDGYKSKAKVGASESEEEQESRLPWVDYEHKD